MNKLFRCDCGTHIVEVGYTKPDSDLDLDDFYIIIYDVYNPDTGRKYKNPKVIGDVVLFNNRYPKELDDFFDFMTKVIKNRKKPKVSNKRRAVYEEDKAMDSAIKRIIEMNKENG